MQQLLKIRLPKGYFENEKDLKGFTISDDPEEAGSAIAFPKNSDLTAKFNKELKKMKENGELKNWLLNGLVGKK